MMHNSFSHLFTSTLICHGLPLVLPSSPTCSHLSSVLRSPGLSPCSSFSNQAWTLLVHSLCSLSDHRILFLFLWVSLFTYCLFLCSCLWMCRPHPPVGLLFPLSVSSFWLLSLCSWLLLWHDQSKISYEISKFLNTWGQRSFYYGWRPAFVQTNLFFLFLNFPHTFLFGFSNRENNMTPPPPFSSPPGAAAKWTTSDTVCRNDN